MIRVENLNVGYNKKQILFDINLHIQKFTINAVIGQSGCGKTTLLKSLNKLIEEENAYRSGKIFIDNVDIDSIEKKSLRKMVGMIFQQPVAFPFSIEKNLTYILNYHKKLTKQALKKEVQFYLEKVSLYQEVKDNLNMSANKLSGGQKQRLAIARSLCIEPKILLLDEPCSALDMKNTIAIENMLLDMKKNYTIIIVTHNLMQAKRIADNIIFMDKGRIEVIQDKKTFFENPSSKLAEEQLNYM